MKNYTYLSIMVLLRFASCIQAMDKPKLEEPTSKEDLLGAGFFVDTDNANNFIISDTTESSQGNEDEFDEALLSQKRANSAKKYRLESAFPLNRTCAFAVGSSADTLSSAVLDVFSVSTLNEAAAPVLESTYEDNLLRDAEAGLITAAAFGHHRSLPLTGNELYDSAGLPILNVRKVASQMQSLPTVPELDEGDSLSDLVAEFSFSGKNCRGK